MRWPNSIVWFLFAEICDAIDFWSFVQYCRTVNGDHNRSHSLWYDIVVGPVVGTLRKQTVIPDFDQISFHTNVASQVLDNAKNQRVV